MGQPFLFSNPGNFFSHGLSSAGAGSRFWNAQVEKTDDAIIV